MNKKFFQNFLSDSQFGPRLVLLVVLLVVVFIQSKVADGQGKTLKKVKKQYALVQRIDEFEKALNIQAESEIVLEQEPELPPKEMILRGMGGRYGVFKVIINDDVYGAGDMFDEYMILRVTNRTVTMKNTETREITTLTLPEFLPQESSN